MKYKLAVILTVIFLGTVSGVIPRAFSSDTLTALNTTVETGVNNAAGVFLVDSLSVASLRHDYDTADSANINTPLTTRKIRILIVPGHEPDFGGAEYKNLKERDIVVNIADTLAALLRTNPKYDVIVARDTTKWNPIFEQYFSREWEAIVAWKDKSKADMLRMVGSGQIMQVPLDDKVVHNTAPTEPAIRLFGINKWIDENGIDIAIHLHLNDVPRRDVSKAGEYDGFAIYIPEKQYSNSKATASVADFVAKRLSKYFPKSNMQKESAGVIEDQDLIAIGKNNTVDAASMLIEYAYIYEPQFSTPEVKDAIAKEYALDTYLGVQDFFGAPNTKKDGADSFLLSREWTDGGPVDILALQFTLTNLGYYPPQGMTKNDCGVAGVMGPCTLRALAAFQKDKGITDEKGTVGPATKLALRARQ